MKIFFTTLFYAKSLAFSLFFCLPLVATAQTVLFSQDFTSSTVASSYQGTGTDQFDFIGIAGATSTNAGWSAAAVGANPANKLRTYRFAGTTALARTTNFPNTATAATVLKVNFSLNVLSHSANTVGTNPAAGNFYIGSGFAAGSSAEADPHSNFLVGYIGGSGTAPASFYLRISVGGVVTNSGSLSAETGVTWVINNSDATISYAAPDGTTKTLINDAADIWAGSTRAFEAVPAVDGSKDLTNFKLFVNNSGGTISLDNIVITKLPTSLPVTLTSFTAKNTGVVNQLTWATESEINNKGYDVQRQTTTGAWETLGFVNGVGKAATYTYEDKAPLSISYYRLRQVDFDGTETLSKVISVSQDTKGRISITPNPASDKVNIILNASDVSNQAATVVLSDITGRQVFTQSTTAATFQLDLSHLTKGMYVMTVQSNGAVYQEKIIRQ